MEHKRGTLFIFAGLWLSLIGLVLGGSVMLPATEKTANAQPALLYKFAANDRVPTQPVPPEKGQIIIADLGLMRLSLYEDGALIKSFPVLSRGKVGTPWETPTGKYRVKIKEKEHFSSIGGTWMPYSMQFYGNFFIHGWPTYSSGDPVPIGYSGGCIRLSTPDSKELYELTSVGTEFIVIGVDANLAFATTSSYYLRGEKDPPEISAASFIVSDIDTGSVLWERSADTLRAPGGLIALPVALTALETVNQYKMVRMSELLIDSPKLRKRASGAKDEIPAGALIYPLMYSTNDTAAKAFASDHGTASFVRSMNEKVAAIGVEHSAFSGVLSDESGTTSARDLLEILTYTKNSKRFLIDVTMTNDHALTASGDGEKFTWENKVPWVVRGDGAFRGGVFSPNASGGGNAMLLFDLPIAEFGSRTIAFVVMDSRDIEGDVERIRSFISGHFVYGIKENTEQFIRETEEPTPSLLRRARDLMDLKRFLRESNDPALAV